MREDIIAVVLIVAILIAIVIVFATPYRGGGTTRWSAPDDFVARSGLKGLSVVGYRRSIKTPLGDQRAMRLPS